MYSLMDGKKLAQKVKDELSIEVQELNKKGIYPKLAVIMVGNNPASKIYVRNKSKACNDVNVKYEEFLLRRRDNNGRATKINWRIK